MVEGWHYTHTWQCKAKAMELQQQSQQNKKAKTSRVPEGSCGQSSTVVCFSESMHIAPRSGTSTQLLVTGRSRLKQWRKLIFLVLKLLDKMDYSNQDLVLGADETDNRSVATDGNNPQFGLGCSWNLWQISWDKKNGSVGHLTSWCTSCLTGCGISSCKWEPSRFCGHRLVYIE